jgi:hypothetical protein
MIGTAKIKSSIVQDVLDNTVKHRRPPIGLNYVAYAVETYPDDANGQTGLLILGRSYNHKYLKQLLSRFSGPGATPEEQISLWEQLLPRVHYALTALDNELVRSGLGENVRVVLDVDMGGYFYHRVNSHTILFGATLDQAQINNGQCDKEMKQMFSELQAVFTAHGA